MSTTLAQSGLGGTSKKVKRLNLMIYGPPGTWKTVNAHHLPNTRTLDFDDGMQSVEWAVRSGIIKRKLDEVVYSTILPPPTLDEAKNNVFDLASDQVDEWVEEEDIDPSEWEAYCRDKHGTLYPQFWDTLILDSGTALSAATLIKGLKETDRLDLSKSWQKRKKKGLTPVMIQDFGAANILFRKFMTMCNGLGKNLVLICHEYQNTDKQGSLRAIEPLLTGQLRSSVPKDFDEVWFARVKGTKQNLQGVFQTVADPMRRCKSRLGCLDPEESADFEAIKEKVAKFYEVDSDRLWVAYHGTEGAKKAAEEDVADMVAV